MALRTREPLTKERILETAVRIMDQEGLEAVTMRRLGRDLGVEAMSLYNHVEDKEDLFHGMIETVMREFVLPEDSVGRWEDRVRILARSYRTVLRNHPEVIQLFAEHEKPMTDAASLRPIETSLEALRASGLPDEEVAEAYKMFSGYIMGFVMQETRGVFAAEHAGISEIDASFPADALPNLAQLFPILCGASHTDDDFDFGIEVMIDGLRDRLKGRRR